MQLHLGPILLWGFLATGMMTMILSGSQQLGWSRISLPYMVGTIFSMQRSRAMVIGFIVHMLIGSVFAIVYGLTFESLHLASWWLGGLMGVLHGLFVLIVLVPLMPSIHPRMAGRHHGPTPTRRLEPPGFLALNYGRRTPLITLLGHLVYGLILGAFYPLVG